jgi:hypothetical protein
MTPSLHRSIASDQPTHPPCQYLATLSFTSQFPSSPVPHAPTHSLSLWLTLPLTHTISPIPSRPIQSNPITYTSFAHAQTGKPPWTRATGPLPGSHLPKSLPQPAPFARAPPHGLPTFARPVPRPMSLAAGRGRPSQLSRGAVRDSSPTQPSLSGREFVPLRAVGLDPPSM